MMFKSEADRLLYNKWVEPGADCGFVPYEDAIGCIDKTLAVRDKGERGVRYYAGIDYGLTKDRTALCVLHQEPNGRLVVDRLDVYHAPGERVKVTAVEAWIEFVKVKFPGCKFVIDPYQLESVIQSMEAKGTPVERFTPRAGAANYEMASNLRNLILNRRIGWYSNCGPVSLPFKPAEPNFLVTKFVEDTFESELANLLIRTTPSGYRFDHVSGKHDDRAVAVGMPALAAINKPIAPPLSAPILVKPEPRDLRNLPFAAERQLFGMR